MNNITIGVSYLNEGKISGIGTLLFKSAFSNNGTIAPGSPIGTLTVNSTSNLFTSNSVLEIEVYDNSGIGTGHDELLRSGNLQFDGILRLKEIGDVVKDTFEIARVSNGTITGNFSVIDVPADYSVLIDAISIKVIKNEKIKQPATIALSNLNHVFDGAAKQAYSTTNPPGLAVNITYNNSHSLPVNAGSYGIRAVIVDDKYQGGVDSSLIIEKSDQQISFLNIPNKAIDDAPFLVYASSSSGLQLQYSITTIPSTGVATIAGNVISLLGPGTVNLFASQLGSGNYNSASDSISFSVSDPVSDILIVSLKYPADGGGCLLGDVSDIITTIQNAGKVAQSNFKVSYTLNNGSPVVETINSVLQPNEKLDYKFLTKADFSSPGNYNFTAYTLLSNDQKPSNDTFKASITRFSTPKLGLSPNQTICVGDQISLTAYGGGKYKWINGPDSNTYVVNPSSTTTYYVNITDSNGCRTELDSVTITVNPNPVIEASVDQIILKGSSAILSATGGINYTWSNGDTTAIIAVSPEITTTYKVSGANAFGCSSTDSVKVNVNFSSLAVSKAIIDFGNIVKDSSATAIITITNNGTFTEKINNISLIPPFSTTFAGQEIAPGNSVEVPISFAPTDILFYQTTFPISTTAGEFLINLKGRGVTAAPGWWVTPSVYNYGNVEKGTSLTHKFTISNTGNVSIQISEVSSLDTIFKGAIDQLNILPGDTAQLTISFKPLKIASYSGSITIKANLSINLGLLKVYVSGAGFQSGAAPELQYVTVPPYNGKTGISPSVGPPGLFTYRIIYKSSDGVAPGAGYPKIGIDKNGDKDFIDAGEGLISMTKVGVGVNWKTGETFTYSTNLPISDFYGYQFFANDMLGNSIVAGTNTYKAGPVVTNKTLDLSIYADDIVFSKDNPEVNESFTLTATVHNTSSYSASNVNVRFYNDSTFLASSTLPFIGPKTIATIKQDFAFAPDGFYPIKVWIDSTNTLGETNSLNNFAIRPVIIGDFSIPGTINVSVNTKTQSCPVGSVLIEGTATYSGLNLEGTPPVLGGTVTIQIFKNGILQASVKGNTTTNGVFSIYWDNDHQPFEDFGIPCGEEYTYSVSVTDYTFTSEPLNEAFTIPCINCNSIAMIHLGYVPGCVTPGKDFIFNSFIYAEDQETFNKVCFPEPLYKDTIEIYENGALTNTFSSDSISACEVVYFNSTHNLPVGSHTLSSIHTYYTKDSKRIQQVASYEFVILPQMIDLSLPPVWFEKIENTGFVFKEFNTSCVTAPAHTIYLYDSAQGYNSKILLDSFYVDYIRSQSYYQFTYGKLNLAIGTHFITLISDPFNRLVEIDENNNNLTVIFDILPPQPADLYVYGTAISNTAITIGSKVNFFATVTNLGTLSSAPCKAVFKIGSNTIGAKVTIPSLQKDSSFRIVSEPYSIPNNCPLNFIAIADIDQEVSESEENNNDDTLKLGTDLIGGRECYDEENLGSSCNPYILLKGELGIFDTPIRNKGTRDADGVHISYSFNAKAIGTDNISYLKPNSESTSILNYSFDTAGTFAIEVYPDYDGRFCELDEENNKSYIFVTVVESAPDLEILSQYISTSNLNPLPGQPVSLVASIFNKGGALATPNKVSFWVDDVQIGVDVSLDTLYPGQDTTVMATATFSSALVGPKIIKVKADDLNIVPELSEINNEATRAIIVGAAPDFAHSKHEAIALSPAVFNVGDSITISNYIRNYGGDAGTFWLKFSFRNKAGIKTSIDSVRLTLASNDSVRVSRKWLVTELEGLIITEITGSNPPEFNEFNNVDSLSLEQVLPLKLLSFNGSSHNKVVWLNWKTTNEENLLRFELEKSSDAINFTLINLTAAYNTPGNHSYAYADNGPWARGNNVSYYRLKLIDKDGMYRYSQILKISNEAVEKLSIVIYPNPAKDLINLQLQIVAEGKYTIRLLDISGRAHFIKTYELIAGTHTLTLPINRLAQGVYFFVLQTMDGNAEYKKFIKE
ncbi:MAG TPA: CARDB domain-containing protein [Panacibacter sp.]|nr:CARDB domain-containing protein [Panacibacter sp.]